MPTSPRHRSYHVVAFSIPIVYTLEGDHDPNGMAYVLKPIEKLLHWAKDRWHDGDRLLPRLHTRRQRAQLVVDGLERLDLMVDRLRQGTEDDRLLLIELIRHEELSEDTDTENRLHGVGRKGGRSMAVRLNVQRQIDELNVALKDLQDVDGPNSWNSPTPYRAEGVGPEDLNPKPIRLVTLTSAQRMAWREEWIAQVKMLDRSIETWFTNCEADPERRFDAQKLSKISKIPLEWVQRLLLNDHRPGSNRGTPSDRFNPMKPIPALRPLVLRCCQGETVEIKLENSLKSRQVGFHVQGAEMSTAKGDGVFYADGAAIGQNLDSTCPPNKTITFHYDARHEGVWPINDLADVRGSENGTNSHGLFAALIVESKGARWCDPETVETLTDVPPDRLPGELTHAPWCSLLDVDIIAANEDVSNPLHKDFVDFHYDKVPRSFREFTVFIHDEPEVHSGLHTVGEHTIMPLSYRAEPMHNRLPHRMRQYAEATKLKPLPTGNEIDRTAFGKVFGDAELVENRFQPLIAGDGIDRTAVTWTLGDELDEQFWTARTATGEYLERVAGEEQHHSSWLFGDPITHIQRAYAGDPCRVRLIHAGVKETHVYHLHVHQWRAVASDTAEPSVHGTDGKPQPTGSQLLDSITIGPQSATTIDPLYGSGSRQYAMGDVIWHCHLYPHFHHGMWGLWRSYDRLVDGTRTYPDGSYCPRLNPLPGRPPADSTLQTPGFPWFINGVFPMKSPPPPVGDNTALNGRRILLKMGPASELERAAMPERCRKGETPGAIFVDLDTDAEKWNDRAKLPKPRIVSYDVEVRADNCHYNVDGWHDPRGHHYRLMKVEIRQWSDSDNKYLPTYTETFTHPLKENPSPFYPRANQGDIVEWRQHNRLNSFPADGFDFGQLPVECGLHVHLVKFDPLSADGSSTGWNYLAGASCREAVGEDGAGELRIVSRHRWVVDEEFGPCFFHDHLLANYRQKHGLFAALIAEPHGSQWQQVDNQSLTAWSNPEAVIVPPAITGLPPFREACLAIADFVPLLDHAGRPLNPPSTLSGDDDPGAMGVNYRNAPLTFRGKDPSQWFSSTVRSRLNFAGVKGDPDTPVIQTYPGERLRIRLIQGSHEEQHGLTIHGMRWRRDWGNPHSTLVNQQTLGISEAFTLDINPADASPYGTGDHLWHFSTADDLWLGCWGLVRSLPSTPENFARFSPLPDLLSSPAKARQALRDAHAVPTHPDPKADIKNARTFVVVAQRTEHLYNDTALTDPWGLIYRTVKYSDKEIEEMLERAIDPPSSMDPKKKGIWDVKDEDVDKSAQPLVLRAQRGEWVRVILVNDLFDEDDNDRDPDQEDDGRIDFGVEPSPPRLPLEHLDELKRPDRRTVSSRVSIHASLLSYDVAKFDGSFVGRNFDTTVAPWLRSSEHMGSHMGGMEIPGAVVHRAEHHGRRNWREYWWYADDHLAPKNANDGPGQVCYLYDMADIRNHRHHGLIGALIVEPGDAQPFALNSKAKEADGWTGLNAEIRVNGKVVARETVVFIQDGLRFFVNGNPDFPMPDVNPTDDPEDSGQKGINYRSHPIHHGVVSRQETPVFPLLEANAGDKIWLRAIGAGDKPRQHTITVHGCDWPQASWKPNGAWTGALTGLSPCRAATMEIVLPHKGDYAVRAGGFRWAAEHGVWSSLRARSTK
jgi:manganese oxidase